MSLRLEPFYLMNVVLYLPDVEHLQSFEKVSKNCGISLMMLHTTPMFKKLSDKNKVLSLLPNVNTFYNCNKNHKYCEENNSHQHKFIIYKKNLRRHFILKIGNEIMTSMYDLRNTLSKVLETVNLDFNQLELVKVILADYKPDTKGKYSCRESKTTFCYNDLCFILKHYFVIDAIDCNRKENSIELDCNSIKMDQQRIYMYKHRSYLAKEFIKQIL